MKKLILIISTVLILTACDPEGDAGTEISGTVSSTSNVKIGIFSSDYWFLDDFSSGEEDVVYEEWDGGTSGSYTPVTMTEPSDDGSYFIAAPGDMAQTGDLIAWIDTNGDNVFDLGTEAGYFPIKNIEGTDYVVSLGYLNFLGTEAIIVSYTDNDSVSQNTDISILGYSGFNFTLD